MEEGAWKVKNPIFLSHLTIITISDILRYSSICIYLNAKNTPWLFKPGDELAIGA
jgi:hypothetical protein